MEGRFRVVDVVSIGFYRRVSVCFYYTFVFIMLPSLSLPFSSASLFVLFVLITIVVIFMSKMLKWLLAPALGSFDVGQSAHITG